MDDGGKPLGASKADEDVEYSDTIKARMIKRMTGPNAMSANALSKEVGISQGTLSRWLRDAGTVNAVATKKPKAASKKKTKKTKPKAEDRSLQEKLRLVLEASELSEDELGAFLRREGLHRAQLEEWRGAATEALGKKPKRRRGKQEPTPEQKRIRNLERKLRHKEKALAEAAALLVLKKKFEAAFGDEDDDTDPTNDE